MKKTKIILFFILFISSQSFADDKKIKQAIDWIMDSCVSSGSKVEFSAEGSGSLRIKSILSSGADGEITLNTSQITGLTDELNKISLENADKVRGCIAPYRKIILDSILGTNEEPDDSKKSEENEKDTLFEIEPNNKFEESTEIKSGVFYEGVTDTSGVNHYDIFMFKSDAKPIKITLDAEESFKDFRVYFYNKTRDEIKEYTVKGGEEKSLEINAPEGRKFIKIGYWNGSHESKYRLLVDY